MLLDALVELEACAIGPCICQARGGACISFFPHAGEGAERRSALRSYVWHLGEGAACFVRSTLASRRSTGGVFHLGTVLPGPGLKSLRSPMSRMAFAILVPGPVPAIEGGPS